MDSISSDLVESFYKDGDDLKAKRRLTAIVGASYLLHLRASEPERLSEQEHRLLESLLEELEVAPDQAYELLKELEERGPSEVLRSLADSEPSSGDR